MSLLYLGITFQSRQQIPRPIQIPISLVQGDTVPKHRIAASDPDPSKSKPKVSPLPWAILKGNFCSS